MTIRFHSLVPVTAQRAGGIIECQPLGTAHCARFSALLTGLVLAGALLWCGSCNAADYGSSVAINGRQLSVAEVVALQNRLGMQIAPGSYLVNFQNGCWANLTNGTSGCLGSSGSSVSRYGSGEWHEDGSWSRYDNSSHFSVGGSGDGCLYAGDWSNC